MAITVESEQVRVFEWRLERLARAGFTGEDIYLLASSAEVDLYAALALVARGCPPETAASILR